MRLQKFNKMKQDLKQIDMKQEVMVVTYGSTFVCRRCNKICPKKCRYQKICKDCTKKIGYYTPQECEKVHKERERKEKKKHG